MYVNVNVIAAAVALHHDTYAVKENCQQTVRRLLSMIDPLEPSENDVATTLMETLNLDDLHNEIQEASGEVVAGAERRVVWASEAGLKTPLCVVFLHGWSSSSSECNPLPERIANACTQICSIIGYQGMVVPLDHRLQLLLVAVACFFAKPPHRPYSKAQLVPYVWVCHWAIESF